MGVSWWKVGVMDAVELHRRAVEDWVGAVRAVDAEAWAASTPCAAWDVRELVNHITYEERWAVPLMQGRTISDVGDALEGDLLGDKPVDAVERAAAEAIDVFAEPGAAARTVALSFGSTPAEEYALQLAADHLIHGWDLKVATGQDRTLPPDVVAGVAAWYVDREELYRGSGSVGDKVDVGPDASDQDRLLSAFGRDPRWSA